MIKSTALVLLFVAATAAAQETPAASPPAALSVYLDCQNTFCDFDYFRTELAMVNWVRDRQVADIHVLVTSQATGAGGNEYTFTFIGLRQFSGVTDTLKWVLPPASTDDERRKGMAGHFKLGFVRYFARTPAGARITVTFPDAQSGSGQTTTKRDRWKAWVFRTSVDGFSFGEETYNERYTNGRIEADRITEGWKTRVSLRESRQRSEQTYPVCDAANVCKDTTVIVKREGYDRTVLQVKSFGPHLSAGLRGSMSASRYENHKRVYRVFPAVEYNVFPYSQSTRRQLRVEYNIGYGHYTYNDVTVNDKTSESMPIQRLLVGVATREPWGSIDVSGNATKFFTGRNEYRLGLFGNVSLRLFKGFELGGFGGYEKIRDQFNLAKKNYSEQEILTRQFQLGTGYSYHYGFELRYTFGSIFNNVVNPRMTSGSF